MEAGVIPQSHSFDAVGVVSAISRTALDAIREQMPDLEEGFPMARRFLVEHHLDPDGWVAVRATYDATLSLIHINELKGQELAELRLLVQGAGPGLGGAQIAALGPGWFGQNRFTYVGPHFDGRLIWTHVDEQVEWWLNTMVVPGVLERNRQRVLRAVPPPPSYDVDRISRALWVLECEEASLQGSAFELGQRGLVTCAHSVGSSTVAFRSSEPTKRYPVEVVAKNDALDLAILRNPEALAGLDAGDPGALRQMDHLMVAGHPNYRLGDTPVVVPGLVVGFRPVSGIRRILTNAAIVAGCSGGPAIGADGRVVGVAVTGADSFTRANETEDHGVIPIDALGILGR